MSTISVCVCVSVFFIVVVKRCFTFFLIFVKLRKGNWNLIP